MSAGALDVEGQVGAVSVSAGTLEGDGSTGPATSSDGLISTSSTSYMVSAPSTGPTGMTATMLSSSAGAVVTDQSVTYTATVSGPTDGGTIEFLDNGAAVSACGLIPVGPAQPAPPVT